MTPNDPQMDPTMVMVLVKGHWTGSPSLETNNDVVVVVDFLALVTLVVAAPAPAPPRGIRCRVETYRVLEVVVAADVVIVDDMMLLLLLLEGKSDNTTTPFECARVLLLLRIHCEG
jgi:hypothetical protein